MTKPPQPIDEVALRNEFRHLLFRSVHIDHQNIEPDEMTITKDGKDYYLDEMVKIASQAVTTALKRVDEALPKLLTEQLYEDIEREYPDLDRTDYFHFGLDQAHQAITNELSKWEKAE